LIELLSFTGSTWIDASFTALAAILTALAVHAVGTAMQLRGIASSADAGKNWDLRCRLREELVDFVRREYPQHLPQLRAQAEVGRRRDSPRERASGPDRPG
jgi:hypothetical protein